MRILVIEDEAKVASFIRRALEEENYAVDVCADGAKGLEMGLSGSYDLVILDLMLPGVLGLEILKELRKEKIQAPVLILTARSQVDQRVKGLDAGADDYLTKPFAIEELLARIRALLRRTTGSGGAGTRTFADLSLDPATREVRRGSQRIELRPTEFALLDAFLAQPGHVLTRAVLYETVWGYDFGRDSKALDVHVGHLRRKLELDGRPRLIHTVRDVGYVLRES